MPRPIAKALMGNPARLATACWIARDVGPGEFFSQSDAHRGIAGAYAMTAVIGALRDLCTARMLECQSAPNDWPMYRVLSAEGWQAFLSLEAAIEALENGADGDAADVSGAGG